MIEIESLARHAEGADRPRQGRRPRREGAEALTGTKLYVPRSRLPEREEEEWYHSDLIGLAALDRDGAHDRHGGRHPQFRRRRPARDAGPRPAAPTVLMPFTRESVPEVDVEGGWLKVVPPEGLFE